MVHSQGQHLGSFRLSEDHKPGRPDEQQRIEGNGGVVDMQAPGAVNGEGIDGLFLTSWTCEKVVMFHSSMDFLDFVVLFALTPGELPLALN